MFYTLLFLYLSVISSTSPAPVAPIQKQVAQHPHSPDLAKSNDLPLVLVKLYKV